MKINYNKDLTISRQENLLQFSLPMIFYTYNNVTSHEFREYTGDKDFLFFNSNFLTKKFEILPISQGSFFIKGIDYPFLLPLTMKNLNSTCVTMGGYVMPYERFVREAHLQLLSSRYTSVGRLLEETDFPVLLTFIKFYYLLFIILLSCAYHKSIVEKVS
jgi:hypothetical protein